MTELFDSGGGDSGGERTTMSTGRPRGGLQNGLPHDLSSFVGRKRELADVVALIERARLVTLTGVGGSGKTRLAIEAARRAAAAMQIEAAFVDMAPVSDPGLIPSSIAAALAIRPGASQTVEDALVGALADRALLVVLDNLEQLLPVAGPILTRLAGSCPELRMLVTSRAPLHVRGEQEYLVEPLVQAEAQTLFHERAREVDSAFEVTAANKAAVEEICRWLDGLPLAIELVAARSKTMSPEALLRRLASGGALPASMAVDAPARQRTLRDTIGWSYGLLSPVEQSVFGRVGVFVGGFGADAAAEVVPDPADPVPMDVGLILDSLVDHSLVQVSPDPQGEPRFGLHETVREFGLGQLSDDDLDGVRRRHAWFFMEALARRTNYGAGGYPGPTGTELDNVRAALTWAEANDEDDIVASLATSAWMSFGMLGFRQEAGRWLAAAERASATAGPAVRAGLFQRLAQHELAYGGDRRRAEALLLRALDSLTGADDPVRATSILIILSHVASDLGEHDVAAEWMEQALMRARTIPDLVRRARFLASMGSSASAVLSPTELEAIANEGLRLGRETGDEHAIHESMLGLGYIALARGENSTAVDLFSETLRLDHNWAAAHSRCWLALAQLRADRLEMSRSLLIESLPYARNLAVVWVSIMTLEAAADWLGAAGRHEQAVSCWATIDAVRSLTLDRTPGDDHGLFDGPRERDRRALSPAAWRAATDAGRARTLDQALAFAFDELVAADLDPRGGGLHQKGRYELTSREREVLALVAAGRSDGEIADALFISKSTAAVHVANIKGKLGAASRVEIVTMALEQGLVAS